MASYNTTYEGNVGELFVKWNANSFLQLCLRLRFGQNINGYAMFNLDNFGTYIYQVVPTTTCFGLVTSH